MGKWSVRDFWQRNREQNKLRCYLDPLCTFMMNKFLLNAFEKGDNRMRKGERKEVSLDRDRSFCMKIG